MTPEPEVANTLGKGERGVDVEATYVLVPSSAGSEDSTMASTEPGSPMPSSAKPMSTDGTCCELGGPESPSTTTCEALDTYNQTLNEIAMTLRDPNGTFGDALPAVLISSAGGSPAKTSPSPDAEPDSTENAAASSSSSPESSTLFDPTGYSSRTYPVCSLATAVGTSESCLERWPTSGTAWRGGFSTAVSSECRSADGVCSSSEPSLAQILEPPLSVPAKYSLSAKAATGILRRARKRGRTLPLHLSAALEAVARTTTTGKEAA